MMKNSVTLFFLHSLFAPAVRDQWLISNEIDQLLCPMPKYLAAFLAKKLSISKSQISVNIYSLSKPKIILKSWVGTTRVGQTLLGTGMVDTKEIQKRRTVAARPNIGKKT